MKNIKISLLGLGVVGSKLLDYVRENGSELSRRLEVQLSIDKVFVRDVAKRRAVDVSDLILTNDPYEAVKDGDIVVECLGGSGAQQTREIVLSAIKAQKAVIMSSKKCLALYGREITDAVRENQTYFRYDATVGGCIPVSSVLESMGKCEKINKIYGICNATSNYILDEMQNNSTYASALQKAKEKGFAENDPGDDVDGFDALYKSVILAGFGMGHWIDCDTIAPTSIKSITAEDFCKARQKESAIKPIFSVENKDGRYSCFVGPSAVSRDSILASVKGSNNMIVISSSESGERAFYGQGAGAKPTASAMFDDLVKTIKEIRH
jgi:homoserine dehydrogenase